MTGTREPSLILADGTVLMNSECGYADHKLHCWVKDLNLAQVFELFSNPELTKEIRFVLGDHVFETYYDFTEIYLIRKMEDYIDIRLEGGTKGGRDNDQNET